jgi:hypothetical protein
MNPLQGKVSRNGRRFLIAAGIILAVTGLAKLFTLTGDTTLLRVRDPIFGVEFRSLMAMVGIIEIFIAGFCVFSKRGVMSTIMVAGISSGFLLYRVGIRSVDWQRPCGCLGNITDVFGIAPQVAEQISVGLLAFLLVGSYGLLTFAISGETGDNT